MSDLSSEDAQLLARWKAGPGAIPTVEDGRRMLQQVRDGVWPRRVSRREHLGTVGCLMCGWKLTGVRVEDAGLIEHDCPAVATRRLTPDEQPASGDPVTPQHHNDRPDANGGDE